jgi:hypothetical protein
MTARTQLMLALVVGALSGGLPTFSIPMPNTIAPDDLLLAAFSILLVSFGSGMLLGCLNYRSTWRPAVVSGGARKKRGAADGPLPSYCKRGRDSPAIFLFY